MPQPPFKISCLVILHGSPTEPREEHNWEGTSGGVEGNMLDEVMGKVKDAGFSIKEIITDKDSSTNAIFCRHFRDCSKKTLHKDLEKIKRSK